MRRDYKRFTKTIENNEDDETTIKENSEARDLHDRQT